MPKCLSIYNFIINTSRLPNISFSIFWRCWVSGWGKNAFINGQLQSTLKEVDLYVWSKTNCQTALQSTRLGTNFVLDDSFMCAGGESDKDACTVRNITYCLLQSNEYCITIRITKLFFNNLTYSLILTISPWIFFKGRWWFTVGVFKKRSVCSCWAGVMGNRLWRWRSSWYLY